MRIFLTVICLCYSALCYFQMKEITADAEVAEERRVVHLSVDDVEAFFDLIRHEEQFPSLFDHPFFGYLKQLHEKNGMKVTLYTYETLGTDSLRSVPSRYRKELRENAGWLKIGFHWPRPEFKEGISAESFRRSYENVSEAICDMADSTLLAPALRLHYFYGPDSLLRSVEKWPVLLTADDEHRPSYDLSPSQRERLNRSGSIQSGSRRYVKTDMRIEGHLNMRHRLRALGHPDTLVIFTHEWALTPQPMKRVAATLIYNRRLQCSALNRRNLELTLRWLGEHKYDYTFL
ncbi:MAG: hypothetical protein HDS85_02665 [Bacteroidales bacterium]|nr:hypothetical protein [Bacteroidales bacterium]